MVAHGCTLHVICWVSWIRWIRVFQWGSRPKQCSGGSIHSHSCGMRRSAFGAVWSIWSQVSYEICYDLLYKFWIEKARVLKSCAFCLWWWFTDPMFGQPPGSSGRDISFNPDECVPWLLVPDSWNNLRLFPPEGIRGPPDPPSPCLGGFMTATLASQLLVAESVRSRKREAQNRKDTERTCKPSLEHRIPLKVTTRSQGYARCSRTLYNFVNFWVQMHLHACICQVPVSYSKIWADRNWH